MSKERESHVKELSSNLKGMKFMAKQDAKRSASFKSNPQREERSYLPFMPLSAGRKSFKNFNQEVEKIEKEVDEERKELESQRKGVSDSEMAARMQAIQGNKRKTEIDSNDTKKTKLLKGKFMKPQD